jgi:hypothetical protein
MTLFSALENLQQTTLQAITGCLRRLEYLSRLRDKDGSYKHWGLARVYGDLRSTSALTEAHRAQLSNFLSTPMRDLEADLKHSSQEAGIPPAAYLDRLSARSSSLLPPAPGAGSGRHLSSVLHALSCLLKTGKRDASPPT